LTPSLVGEQSRSSQARENRVRFFAQAQMRAAFFQPFGNFFLVNSRDAVFARRIYRNRAPRR
jgi:hypothetical protein